MRSRRASHDSARPLNCGVRQLTVTLLSRPGVLRMSKQTVAALLLGAIGGFLAATFWHRAAVTAQSKPAAVCAWPDSLDAVAAAPNNHRVVLENDRVRVLDVTVAPGETEPLHAHCRSSVMYLMQEGVYRDYDADGRLIESVDVAPDPSRFPMTLWLDPQAPHAVHNLDSRPTRLLRIELKQ